MIGIRFVRPIINMASITYSWMQALSLKTTLAPTAQPYHSARSQNHPLLLCRKRVLLMNL
jgi:hypothetical protein